MAFEFLRRLFPTQPVQISNDVAGQYGFGAPFQIQYKKRPLPPVDNNGSMAYQTYLAPRYTPIGGGIPNQRDIGTAMPAYSRQGVLVAPVTGNGILAGAFGSGPLTNVDTEQSIQPVPGMMIDSFMLPAN